MNSGLLDSICQAQAGDKDSLSRLVEDNSPLIWSIVKRYFGRGVEADDLFQLGSIGFIKAVMGYDIQFGTQFSTYAVPKIAGEIRRFLRDDGMVKVSRNIKENSVKVFAAREAYEKKHGCEPRLSQLCLLTGLDEEDIILCQQASGEVTSLDGQMNDDGFSLEAVIGSTGDEEKLVEKIALADAVESLETTQKAVIKLRYFKDLTQQKTAQVLGLSQVQVSRIEKKACQQIRKLLE